SRSGGAARLASRSDVGIAVHLQSGFRAVWRAIVGCGYGWSGHDLVKYCAYRVTRGVVGRDRFLLRCGGCRLGVWPWIGGQPAGVELELMPASRGEVLFADVDVEGETRAAQRFHAGDEA